MAVAVLRPVRHWALLANQVQMVCKTAPPTEAGQEDDQHRCLAAWRHAHFFNNFESLKHRIHRQAASGAMASRKFREVVIHRDVGFPQQVFGDGFTLPDVSSFVMVSLLLITPCSIKFHQLIEDAVTVCCTDHR